MQSSLAESEASARATEDRFAQERHALESARGAQETQLTSCRWQVEAQEETNFADQRDHAGGPGRHNLTVATRTLSKDAILACQNSSRSASCPK
mmetsp:Transcript_21215/g.46096  ORF Transcript_21215/g.46096 Transcript_21215/m.46096 type:complete len:94 (-) Transcript_21215:686-967(-)